MGAVAVRMLGHAVLNWVRITAKPIAIPRMIRYTSKANTDYAGTNSNNLTADLQNIVTKYGAVMPSQSEIAGYQNAVKALDTILKDFQKNTTDFNLFKNTMAQLIGRRISYVSTATQQQIASRVGNAMHWGTAIATLGTKFDSDIFMPLYTFLETLVGGMSSADSGKMSKSNLKLVSPVTIAAYIHTMLN